MYTDTNYQSKKALKEALATGASIHIHQPGGMFNPPTANVSISLEGPHYPEAHRWYASAETDENSCVIQGSVK